MLQIVKGVKLYNAAIAAVSAEQQSESGGDSYCCLDYLCPGNGCRLSGTLSDILILCILIHCLFDPCSRCQFLLYQQCWWTNWGQGLYPQIRKIFICIPFVCSCVQHCAVPYTLSKAEDKRTNWSMTTLLRSTPAPTPALITGIFTAFHPVDSVHLLSKALCSFLFFAQIWASSELNFPVGHC
jgi:hypothetical protein